MAQRLTPIASYRGADSTFDRRGWNLALAFQEVFTAIVRLRYNRQTVPDAEVFRAHVRDALGAAEQEARNVGYKQEDIRQALFAMVAFLDESVLNCSNPVFADWPRRPLQEELFGGHVAGEIFFHNLQQVLNRADSHETSDLLEVYYLCMLLGYKGRFGAGGGGELVYIMKATEDKIRRVRSSSSDLSPRWSIPPEAARVAPQDSWSKRLQWAALVLVLVALVLFGLFKFSLHSDPLDLRTLTAQGRS